MQRFSNALKGGLLALLVVIQAQAGTTGRIAGRVVDGSTGEPLPGATVMVVETGQGAATDVDGFYSIINVKPGTFTLVVSYVGYAETRVQNVEVIVDKTTTIDVQLQEAVVEGEEIVLTAERPLVEIDRTTTTSFISEEQLESLPVNNLSDVVNLQAGVVDGHFRGGREREVAYLLNGVPIMNPYNNTVAFDVEKNMVSGLEVISGVFNAEYGQAMSGVVNIITKDVPREWTGSVSGEVGSVLSNRELEYVERLDNQWVPLPSGDSLFVTPGPSLPIQAFRSAHIPYYEAAGMLGRQDVQLSIGGPILKDRLGFQVIGRRFFSEGHVIARNLFAPSDSSAFVTFGAPDTWLIASTGDQAFTPQYSERYSVNGSVMYRLNRSVRAEYNVFYQDNKGRDAPIARKYTPEGVNGWYNVSQLHLGSLRFTFGGKAFANVNYSYLRDSGGSRLYDVPAQFEETGILDPRYVSDRVPTRGSNGFDMGGNDLFTGTDLSQTHTVLADYTNQINRVHQMKVGASLRMHSLSNRSYGIEISNRTGFQPMPSVDPYGRDTLETSPYEFAAYIQDKMEFKNLIVNAGLRFDYFNPDFLIPWDWSRADSAMVLNEQGQLVSNRLTAPSRYQVSPRLGIAFPISASGVIRFSAGMFFQIPQLSFLYQNSEFEVPASNSSILFGNPAINPERTLHFEVGLQQALTDALGMELTVFAKDIRNLTGVTYGPFLRTSGDFRRYSNEDVGTSQGITLSLFQRPVGALAWDVDYTLQFAEGTSSNPEQAYQRWKAGQGSIVTLNRLDWDRRHVLTNSITFEPSRQISFNVINRFMAGTPYTTQRDDIVSFIPNNEPRPAAFLSDLRLHYRPAAFNGLGVTMQVENVFDAKVHWGVYSSTGRADEAVEMERYRRTYDLTNTSPQGVNSLDEYFVTQNRFSAPRRVILGVQYNF